MSPPAAPAQGDFFICDILEAIPKDDLATMEHPVFSLSTRPDRRVLRYEHGPARIEITPSVKGLATIHDKDVLIYCVSQLVAAQNAGRPISAEVQLTAHDLLIATRRDTSGDGYRRLRLALERLSGTRIVTTIPTGGVEATRGFGLIEAWEILRKTRDGRMISARVRLSDWLFRAVRARSVLTLSREYFGLRKPLERRVYEIARKHCGRQSEWRIGLETLGKKSGSTSPRRVFRKMIRDMAAADPLPDYRLELDPRDIVVFTPRHAVLAADPARLPQVGAAALEAAREAAPGWDVHAILDDWQRHWLATGQPRLRAPEAAFVAFARARAARAAPRG